MKQVYIYFFAILLLTTATCLSPLMAANLTVIPLWSNGVPESNGITEPEITEPSSIGNVTLPTMTVYPATGTNTGAAVVICPGGAYIRQAAVHEGSQLAEWLSANGITAFLLKYRLPNGHAFIPGKDVLKALELVRSRSAEWGVHSDKIGVCGFSAGGHLASTAGTHFTATTNRPDFVVLFYPVISMADNITHRGSKTQLLGSSATNPDSIAFYSNELRVTAQTPPTLLLLSDDDKGVVPQNSLLFYQALKKVNVPAAMYLFPEGGHGWGYRPTFRYHETWKALLIDWLKQGKFIQ